MVITWMNIENIVLNGKNQTHDIMLYDPLHDISHVTCYMILLHGIADKSVETKE